jgi:hypothetical protein
MDRGFGVGLGRRRGRRGAGAPGRLGAETRAGDECIDFGVGAATEEDRSSWRGECEEGGEGPNGAAVITITYDRH